MKIKEFTRYSISKCGQVVNLVSKNHVAVFLRNGYPCVALSKDGTRKHQKIRFLHRLLAQAFIKNPNRYKVVNHKDGNKLNYSLENLEWCTYSYNNTHAFKTGLNVPKSGEKSHASKLDILAVELVRELLQAGFSQSSIALLLEVSRGCIQAIHQNKTWKV